VRRRVWCGLAFGAAVAVSMPLAAQSARVAKLCVLSGTARRFSSIDWQIKRLGERGWTEGRNLVVEFRMTESDTKRAELIARELAHLKCDVILATSTPAALAVHAQAPTTPMVFDIGGDPVALGLVATLQRPGGQATGFVQQFDEIAAKQLSLLRELAPASRRVAVMFDHGNSSMLQGMRTIDTAAKRLGLSVHRVPVRDYEDVDKAHRDLLREPADALLVLHGTVTAENASNISRMANRLQLPAVYGSREFIEGGGLLSYGVYRPTLLADIAGYVARILDGAKPADLPVQQPTRFELVVNLGLARTLGMTIPQSVLLQATEVIQ
jgi:putative ABC transport system substrate-binding protein